ncbi:MAG: DinB family protein [Fimbriimonadales bacterium]
MNFANPSIAEMLRLGLEYDLWANMRWYNALRMMKDQEQGSPVLQHILTTQRTWLERCGEPVTSIPRAATIAAFEAASAAWLKLVTSQPLDKMIDYQDHRGRPHQRQLGEIAWHVINHGTFHRGHLRGLAHAEGFEEFADTDLIIFFDEARKK